MSSISKHHSELINGVGKCSVPMWQGGGPSGFCDKPAFGEYIDGIRYADGPMRGKRFDNKFDGYVPALACPCHGGPNKEGPTNGHGLNPENTFTMQETEKTQKTLRNVIIFWIVVIVLITTGALK